MADFNLAYAPVAKWEGGWTHDSGDKGGETFRGCARNFFPNEPIWPVIDREKSHPSYKKGKAAFSAHLLSHLHGGERTSYCTPKKKVRLSHLHGG